MIRRETDAALINRIANHPAVYSDFAMPGCGSLDFAEVARRTDDHVILTDGEAVAAICEWSAPGVWQVHVMAMPDARGAPARDILAAARDWMFAFGARMLWAQVPVNKPHVGRMASMVGFTRCGLGHLPIVGEVRYYEAVKW